MTLNRSDTSSTTPDGAPLAGDHLATAHLLHGLKARTVSSGAITVAAQAARLAINLGGTLILVRLLTPDDFGVVAMVATIIGFMRVFKDIGLSTVTVQRDDISQAQVSNLFWINVAVSTAAAAAVAAAAPLLVAFYDEPRLAQITPALSTALLVSGMTTQHTAVLQRQMRLTDIARIDVGAMLIGTALGIALAQVGFAYWALVVMNVGTAAASLTLTWMVSRWRPSWPTRDCEMRSLIGFGANLTAGGLIFSVARGADSLLIGKLYGADGLGLYSRASVLLVRPLELFVSPLEAVILPALSRLQSDAERYRRAFLRAYESMAMAGALVTGLLLGLARPLTIVILGDGWEDASPIFAGFAAVAFFIPLCAACNWLMVSQGRGHDSLKTSVIVSIITFAAFVAGAPYGPAAVATVYSISGLLIQVPAVFSIAGREGLVRTRELWLASARYLPLWAAVCVTAWSVQRFSGLTASLQLAAGVAAGLSIGTVVIAADHRSRELVASLVDTVLQLARARRYAGAVS